MKRRILIALVLLCTCSFLLMANGQGETQSGPAADDGKPIKLKLASVSAPPGQFLNSDGVQWWMDEVTKRTDGRVTFDTFWNASVGSGPAHLELLTKGMVDIILGCRIYTPGVTPLGPYHYVIPFGPTDPSLVARATRQMYEEIPAFREELAAQNGLLLSNFVTMPYNIISKTKVNTLEEFEGKKIGLIGQYFGRWATPAGLVPVVAPMHDRYTLMQTGVTEMDFHPMTHMNAFKVQELAKYLINVEAMVGAPWDLIINLEKFNSLPEDIQQIMIEVGKEAELVLADQLRAEWDEKLKKEWGALGIEFIDFPTEERNRWANLVEDIPAEWAQEMEERGLPGYEIIHRFQEITTEMGYTWAREWAVQE
ncbi:MAG: TRAP transporter substrate-binding protein DctP [Sphaerochaetaceae bacterium]|nr:TRAP transporter substrate-binding protein DctP [Sphaerochaetaceae bacterium]